MLHRKYLFRPTTFTAGWMKEHYRSIKRSRFKKILTSLRFMKQLWFCSYFYFCVFIFIIPKRHIHSRTVKRRLDDIGISAVDPFTYQHDNSIGQIAKFAILFSQQNNVTNMDHLPWLYLNAYGMSFAIASFHEYPNPKSFRKISNHYYMILQTFHRDLLHLL